MRDVSDTNPETLLVRGEVRPALDALRRESKRRSWAELRSALLRALDDRGFDTRGPAALRASLEEIRGIGPGFDLYDLCQALAARGGSTFPELAPFVKEMP